jgi:DNA-binding GntR family transcriptional regulator
LFQQLEPVSLPERAANALKDAFFSGQLKPGDTIVEREIAKRLGSAQIRIIRSGARSTGQLLVL